MEYLLQVMWDLFKEAHFDSYEEYEEYKHELSLIFDEETIKERIQDLNNRILNPVTHKGRYNMTQLSNHLNRILRD